MNEQKSKDDLRELLRQNEDQLLRDLDATAGDPRWLALAKTHLELAFMCWKRAVYEGKRVGDP